MFYIYIYLYIFRKINYNNLCRVRISSQALPQLVAAIDLSKHSLINPKRTANDTAQPKKRKKKKKCFFKLKAFDITMSTYIS